ncbi:hypothetical protein AOLI_G00001990 [Acnodon oligacanthus]
MGVTTQLAGPRARLWAAICFEMLERLTEGAKKTPNNSAVSHCRIHKLRPAASLQCPGSAVRLVSAGIGSQSDGPLEQTLVTSNLASGH